MDSGPANTGLSTRRDETSRDDRRMWRKIGDSSRVGATGKTEKADMLVVPLTQLIRMFFYDSEKIFYGHTLVVTLIKSVIEDLWITAVKIHSWIKWLRNFADATGRLTQKSLELWQIDYKVKHLRMNRHRLSDPLPRLLREILEVSERAEDIPVPYDSECDEKRVNYGIWLLQEDSKFDPDHYKKMRWKVRRRHSDKQRRSVDSKIDSNSEMEVDSERK